MVLYLNGQDLNLTEKFLHFVHMRSLFKLAEQVLAYFKKHLSLQTF